jgi:phage/plasmid primase-like uncharacterized protein
MAGKDNLKPPINKRSTEEQREIRSKGGKKSGEKRRELKTMREMLNYLLAKEITNNKGEKATTLEAVMVAQIKEAMKGNTRAVQFIRDTIGEMPKMVHEVENKGINIVVADKEHKKMLEDL